MHENIRLYKLYLLLFVIGKVIGHYKGFLHSSALFTGKLVNGEAGVGHKIAGTQMRKWGANAICEFCVFLVLFLPNLHLCMHNLDMQTNFILLQHHHAKRYRSEVDNKDPLSFH